MCNFVWNKVCVVNTILRIILGYYYKLYYIKLTNQWKHKDPIWDQLKMLVGKIYLEKKKYSLHCIWIFFFKVYIVLIISIAFIFKLNK